MKTFAELKLNKKITKDGLALYKVMIIPKEEKDKIFNNPDESVRLNIDTDNDRYFLNRDTAIAVACFTDVSIHNKLYAVMKITINVDKDDPVLDYPTENQVDLDPQYDKINEIISVTTRDRIISMSVELLEIYEIEILKAKNNKITLEKIDCNNLLNVYQES